MVNFSPAADLQSLAPPTQAPASLRGFEVDYAVNHMWGQPELWWQAVGLFIRRFADWEAQWQAAQGAAERELHCVRNLRQASAEIGAHHLSCVAGVLDELLAKTLAGQTTAPVPPSLRYHLQDCYRELWRTATDAYFGPCGYPGQTG